MTRPYRATRAAVRRALHQMGSVLVACVPRDIECLLVVRGSPASEIKLQRVRSRVEFALGRQLSAKQVRVTATPSFGDIVRARLVVEVDAGAVPRWAHRAFRHVFAMDYERHAFDAWEMVRISYFADRARIRDRRAAVRSQFDQFVERLTSTGKDRVYLFGTGPSLEAAAVQSFDDGYVVVCNTIVRDKALWAHLRPSFIAAGDAIYHFGHTEHARAFRRDLRSRLLESNGQTMFVYPEMFDAVVRREIGDLASQLAPFPFGTHDDITRSLVGGGTLPASSNVLNILLLPLACTLAQRVQLWGFDGRSPTDKLFWSNSSKHAYPEFMPALVEEHPAFYETLVPKGRETEYVNMVHGDELERKLSAAEQRGFEFRMMHASWTETLNRRFRGIPAHEDGQR